MGTIRPRPLILDAGALIAFERPDRRLVTLLELPAPCTYRPAPSAKVWRNPARQVRLVRLLAAQEFDAWDLDVDTAKAAGHLCGATGTDGVIDASVVLLARARGGVVVASDVVDIRRIDPGVDVVDWDWVGGPSDGPPARGRDEPDRRGAGHPV